MLTLRNWEFFLRETFINIRRNGLMTVAAISTVVVSLCILGSFLLAVVNLESLATDIARKVEITLFFKKRTRATEAEVIRRDIDRLPGVKEVRYVSRDQALQRLKKRLEGQIDFSDIEKSNPLPDSLEVRVTNPDLVRQVVAQLERLEQFDKPEYGEKYAQRILHFNRAVKVVGAVTGGLLILSILLIINNTIRLTIFARRREIRIMQLVGATNWFIKVPFLLEGIFHGLMGSIVASLLLVVGYTYGARHLASTLPFVPVLSIESLLLPFLGTVNLMGLLFGYTGSLWSIRRFLASL
jgi:cell division transport system permease protein